MELKIRVLSELSLGEMTKKECLMIHSDAKRGLDV
jgi:hypothetical protein